VLQFISLHPDDVLVHVDSADTSMPLLPLVPDVHTVPVTKPIDVQLSALTGNVTVTSVATAYGIRLICFIVFLLCFQMKKPLKNSSGQEARNNRKNCVAYLNIRDPPDT